MVYYGRQIQSIEAIVQTQSPDTAVSDTNNTEGSYAWDIRFNTTGIQEPVTSQGVTTPAQSPNPCHQRFYYRPSTYGGDSPWEYSDRAADDCSDRTDMLMGYDNSGPESVGVSTGTFTNFDSVFQKQHGNFKIHQNVWVLTVSFRIYQKVGLYPKVQEIRSSHPYQKLKN